ncbi:MAG: tryptophan synthase subunit alpha [Eubacteriales bacterium]|nr:tryptophan synthase subunit alpha [Sarcina sp.]MBR2729224.1 tryptophan synthase subunit alpha [Lachnospiraceae bacterium]MDO4417693.1 tryptophan synthase subunit alpha [Eubacteriales bacterium]
MKKVRTIRDAFDHGKAFIPFITAGDPDLESTRRFILAMEEAGADLIEIGIPFSDPIAEGIVIQEADIRALASGTTTDRIFDMVADLRRDTDMPLVFMGYLNPVFYYGYERFFTRCEEVGISGVIIPDLPFEEKGECAETAAAHGVDVISMIAPTSEDRIRMIAGEAKGFLYVVSSMGVTGVRSEIRTDLASIIAAIRQATEVPAGIGFGINTPQQAAEMAQLADAVIVGSAIVRLIAEHGREAEPFIRDYVQSMKKAVSRR